MEYTAGWTPEAQEAEVLLSPILIPQGLKSAPSLPLPFQAAS